MTIVRSLARHLTPSLVISVLALIIASSTGAYALATLGKGDVQTRHLAKSAVSSPKVKNFSLRLHDLGGPGHLRTATTSQQVDIPGGECRMVFLTLDNPPSPGVIGSLVVGHVTDSAGDAVMSNSGVVVPTMISETSQGGAIANLVICAAGPETIPSGSVFHYQLISPGK
jgi:hypothetical protein